MTLTKHKMIAEIGRRTRLKNRDVQLMLEALIEIWDDELVRGGRIELENFIVLETQIIDRGEQRGLLRQGDLSYKPPRIIHRLILRPSKSLKQRLQGRNKDQQISDTITKDIHEDL